VLGVFEHVAGGLVNGHRTGAGYGVGLLAGVELKGLEVEVLRGHGKAGLEGVGYGKGERKPLRGRAEA
jgi:hypothetical protein